MLQSPQLWGRWGPWRWFPDWLDTFVTPARLVPSPRADGNELVGRCLRVWVALKPFLARGLFRVLSSFGSFSASKEGHTHTPLRTQTFISLQAHQQNCRPFLPEATTPSGPKWASQHRERYVGIHRQQRLLRRCQGLLEGVVQDWRNKGLFEGAGRKGGRKGREGGEKEGKGGKGVGGKDEGARRKELRREEEEEEGGKEGKAEGGRWNRYRPILLLA